MAAFITLLMVTMATAFVPKGRKIRYDVCGGVLISLRSLSMWLRVKKRDGERFKRSFSPEKNVFNIKKHLDNNVIQFEHIEINGQ